MDRLAAAVPAAAAAAVVPAMVFLVHVVGSLVEKGAMVEMEELEVLVATVPAVLLVFGDIIQTLV